MSSSIRLGITAVTAIFLIASLVAYLSPVGGTGLFVEQHGHCTTVTGGVHSYRYCGFDVYPVHKEVGFKPGRTDVGFVPSAQQQHTPFTKAGDEGLHRLSASWPKQQAGRIAAGRLDESPFPQERFAAQSHLFDDPYKATPWEDSR